MRDMDELRWDNGGEDAYMEHYFEEKYKRKEGKMVKKQTQKSEVLKYLKKHKTGLTSMQAFELFGDTRLASTIFELRKRYEIATIHEEGQNRFGATVRYARYVFKGEK